MSKNDITEDNGCQEISLERKQSFTCLLDQRSETNLGPSESKSAVVTESKHEDGGLTPGTKLSNIGLDTPLNTDPESMQNSSLIHDLQVQASESTPLLHSEKEVLVRGTGNSPRSTGKVLVIEQASLEKISDDRLRTSENTNTSNDIDTVNNVESSGLKQKLERREESDETRPENTCQSASSRARDENTEGQVCDQSDDNISSDSRNLNYQVISSGTNDEFDVDEAEDGSSDEEEGAEATPRAQPCEEDERACDPARSGTPVTAGAAISSPSGSTPRGSFNRGHVRVAGRPQAPQRPLVLDVGLADDFVDGEEEDVFFLAMGPPTVAETAPDLTPGDLLLQASQTGIAGLVNPIEPMVLSEAAPQGVLTPSSTGPQSSVYSSAVESPLAGDPSPPALLNGLTRNDNHHQGADDVAHSAHSGTGSTNQSTAQPVCASGVNENNPTASTGSSTAENNGRPLPLNNAGLSGGNMPPQPSANRPISLSNKSPQNIVIVNISNKQDLLERAAGSEDAHKASSPAEDRRDSDECLDMYDHWDSTDDDLDESPDKPPKEQTGADKSSTDVCTDGESQLIASAENDFMSLEVVRHSSSPVIDHKERTDQDADALLNQIITGRAEKGMGPNSAFPVAECSKTNNSDEPSCILKPKLGGNRTDGRNSPENVKQNVGNADDSRQRKRKGGGYGSSTTAHDNSGCESSEVDGHDETSHGIPDILNHSSGHDSSQDVFTNSTADCSISDGEVNNESKAQQEDSHYDGADGHLCFPANHSVGDLGPDAAEKDGPLRSESEQFDPGDMVADTNSNLMKHSVSRESGLQEDLAVEEEVGVSKITVTYNANHCEGTEDKCKDNSLENGSVTVTHLTNEANTFEIYSVTSASQKQTIQNSEHPNGDISEAKSPNKTKESLNSTPSEDLESESTQLDLQRIRLDTIYEDASGDMSSANVHAISTKKDRDFCSQDAPAELIEDQYMSPSDQQCAIKHVVSDKSDATLFECSGIHTQQGFEAGTDTENCTKVSAIDNVTLVEGACTKDLSVGELVQQSPAPQVSVGKDSAEKSDCIKSYRGTSPFLSSPSENIPKLAADGTEGIGESLLQLNDENNLGSPESISGKNRKRPKTSPPKLETGSLNHSIDQIGPHKVTSPPKPVQGGKKKVECPCVLKASERSDSSENLTDEVNCKTQESKDNIEDELAEAKNVASENEDTGSFDTNENPEQKDNAKSGGTNPDPGEAYKNTGGADTNIGDQCETKNESGDQVCCPNEVNEQPQLSDPSSCSPNLDANREHDTDQAPLSHLETQESFVDTEKHPQVPGTTCEDSPKTTDLKDEETPCVDNNELQVCAGMPKTSLLEDSATGHTASTETGETEEFPVENGSQRPSSYPEKGNTISCVNGDQDLESTRLLSDSTSGQREDQTYFATALQESSLVEDTPNSNASRCPDENDTFPYQITSNSYTILETPHSPQGCSSMYENISNIGTAKVNTFLQQSNISCRNEDVQQNDSLNRDKLSNERNDDSRFEQTEDYEEAKVDDPRHRESEVRPAETDLEKSFSTRDFSRNSNDNLQCLPSSDNDATASDSTLKKMEETKDSIGISKQPTPSTEEVTNGPPATESLNNVIHGGLCKDECGPPPTESLNNVIPDGLCTDECGPPPTESLNNVIHDGLCTDECGPQPTESLNNVIPDGLCTDECGPPPTESLNNVIPDGLCTDECGPPPTESLNNVIPDGLCTDECGPPPTESLNNVIHDGLCTDECGPPPTESLNNVTHDGLCTDECGINAGQKETDKESDVNAYSETNTPDVDGDNSFSSYEDSHDHGEERPRSAELPAQSYAESYENVKSSASSDSTSATSHLEDSKAMTRPSSSCSSSTDKQPSRTSSVASGANCEDGEKEAPSAVNSCSSSTTSATLNGQTKMAREVSTASPCREPSACNNNKQTEQNFSGGETEQQERVSPEKLILEATDLWLEKISDFCKSPTVLSDSRSDARLHQFTAECKSQILSISKLKLGASASMHGSSGAGMSPAAVHAAPQVPQTAEAAAVKTKVKVKDAVLSGKSENELTALEKPLPKLTFGNGPRQKNARLSTRAAPLSYTAGGGGGSSHPGAAGSRRSKGDHLPGPPPPSAQTATPRPPHHRAAVHLVQGRARHTDGEMSSVAQCLVPPPSKSHGRGDVTVVNPRSDGPDDGSAQEKTKASDADFGGENVVALPPQCGEDLQLISKTAVTAKEGALCRPGSNRLRRRSRTETKLSGEADEEESATTLRENKCPSPSQQQSQAVETPQKLHMKTNKNLVSSQEMKICRENQNIAQASPASCDQTHSATWPWQKSGLHTEHNTNSARCLHLRPPMKIGIPDRAYRMGLPVPPRDAGREPSASALRKRYRPQRILTVKEFEKEQLARHLNLDFRRIHKTGPSVDCHMDPYVMRRARASVERQRAKTNHDSLLALENCKFLHILKDTKSVYHNSISQPPGSNAKSRGSSSQHGSHIGQLGQLNQLGQYGQCVSSPGVSVARQRQSGDSMAGQWAGPVRSKMKVTNARGLDSYIQAKMKVPVPQPPSLAR
ncbi:hypothetical protein EGW08_015545 [Elysia chlorotica]|uniref:Uncharacterized protein n=1 Tax=Elysia chlorotica TaxID=188477 RepID=A0A3S1BBG0_ELYCH|nr:hypothetical protein EGW08_015545 [Elysia chlorotica]